MKRKVVQHGPATLIVSLPSKWVKKYEVDKGSELEVTEEDNRLIISTDSTPTVQEVSVDITGLDRTSIIYTIRSLYRLGYDNVKVTFKDAEVDYQRENKKVSVLSIIHTEVNRLIGFEIIQEREHYCEIKDLQTISTKEFDQILRRVFLLLIDASKDFVEGVKTGNVSLLETIDHKHDTITKFVSYCMRILNKKGYSVPKKTAYYYHIVAYLDMITDVIKYAAQDAIKLKKKKLSKESLKIIETVANDIRAYYELFYTYKNSKINEINTNRYVAEKLMRSLPESEKHLEHVIIVSVYQILEMLLHLIEARTALEY